MGFHVSLLCARRARIRAKSKYVYLPWLKKCLPTPRRSSQRGGVERGGQEYRDNRDEKGMDPERGSRRGERRVCG